MLFSERYFLRQALLKKADMNRVRDLFTAKAILKNWAPPVAFCYICECNMDDCHHDDCCQDAMDDPYNTYCPRCGEFVQEDDDY